LPAARVIEQGAGEDELISWTVPLGTEVQSRLLIVVLEKRESIATLVPIGSALLTAPPEHGQQKSGEKRDEARTFRQRDRTPR